MNNVTFEMIFQNINMEIHCKKHLRCLHSLPFHWNIIGREILSHHLSHKCYITVNISRDNTVATPLAVSLSPPVARPFRGWENVWQPHVFLRNVFEGQGWDKPFRVKKEKLVAFFLGEIQRKFLKNHVHLIMTETYWVENVWDVCWWN